MILASRSVLLINTNVVRPPVSPVGLEYVAESLAEAGVPLQILDLPFETDWQVSLKKTLSTGEPLLVGISVRNTDDCSFLSGLSFLPWLSEVVNEVRKLTAAPVFLGGVGFSTLPETVLRTVQADGGIAGDGEEALLTLVNSLAKGEDYHHVPNLVYWHNDSVIRNPRSYVDLSRLPLPRRRTFNNQRYQQFGAMVGLETKRGCSQQCIFCADPVAKGNNVRLRPPSVVAQEFTDLLQQDVSWFHLCDSEFNLPLNHAKDVCRAIISEGLGDRIRWYTYCSPVPFDHELVRLMKRAGCAGINFGVDSLCDEQLQRLHRSHSQDDVVRLVDLLHEEKLNYMFDLLIGAPGETLETVKATVDKAKELDVSLVGIAAGVRVYPGTPLGNAVATGTITEGLRPATGADPTQPLFYLSPSLGDDIATYVNQLVSGDPRFLVLSAPGEEGSYNYAGDELLSRLIEQGARGAYWDILRNYRKA